MAALFAALMLAGCAGTAITNKPLAPAAMSPDPNGPISTGGYRVLSLYGDRAAETLVLLSFSGGGKRSAAFGYGVLRGLRDFPVVIDGVQMRLLDEVDVMSSVSGGSFPAAYYALYHDRIFTDFEKDFLDQDIEAYIWGTYLLPWNLGWLFRPDWGTNDRMAEVYDKLMFRGATFADLMQNRRPMVSIDATDVNHGVAFPFLQNQFDLLCSDLTSFSVARAVAASNGFPILFSPITLRSYRVQCGNRMPAWVRGRNGYDPLSRLDQQARTARLHLDADNTRYVHLMDGGIADNLAMRSMISAMLVITGEEEAESRFDFSHIRRILLISADGQAANDASTARNRQLSGLGQIFKAVSGTQISSYNFETMILARNQLEAARETVRRQRCANGPVAVDGHPCGDVESFFVHLSLADIADEAKRQQLQTIRTGLTIPPADVALLVAAGEEQVRTSQGLAAFRDSLK